MMESYATAPFFKRMLAFLFDLAVLEFIVLWPMQDLIKTYFDNSLLSDITSISEVIIPAKVYLLLLIISILMLFYFSFFEYYLEQTLGMMLLKIKMVSLKDDLSVFRAIIRNCFIIPFFPFYIFWIVDPLYLAFYKERFLEKITMTKTIMSNGKEISQFKLKKV